MNLIDIVYGTSNIEIIKLFYKEPDPIFINIYCNLPLIKQYGVGSSIIHNINEDVIPFLIDNGHSIVTENYKNYLYLYEGKEDLLIENGKCCSILRKNIKKNLVLACKYRKLECILYISKVTKYYKLVKYLFTNKKKCKLELLKYNLEFHDEDKFEFLIKFFQAYFQGN